MTLTVTSSQWKHLRTQLEPSLLAAAGSQVWGSSLCSLLSASLSLRRLHYKNLTSADTYFLVLLQTSIPRFISIIIATYKTEHLIAAKKIFRNKAICIKMSMKGNLRLRRSGHLGKRGIFGELSMSWGWRWVSWEKLPRHFLESDLNASEAQHPGQESKK